MIAPLPVPLPPAGWCAALARAEPQHAAVLRAFGPSTDPHPCSLSAVSSWWADAEPRLLAAVTATLSGEVDPDQAGVFRRRVGSVSVLLERIRQPTLRLGLAARTAEVLHAPAPRALRVRALADFYYSQAARLHHQAHSPRRSIAEAVAGVRWSPVAQGVDHAPLIGPGPAGPLHVHLLRGDRAGLRCVHLGPHARPLHEEARARGAVAAVSGGFFLYSEPDIPPPLARRDPVGLLLQDGRVVAGPTLRRATLWSDAHGLHIRRVGPVGWTLQVGSRRVRIAACNTPDAAGPTWFNRAWGPTAPRPGLQVRGGTARGTGTMIDLLGGVLVGGGPPLASGAVHWLPPEDWTQAMAGGPMLVGPDPVLDLAHEDFAADAPPITFSRDETYDQNLLPRLAAGLDAQDRVVFAAIDGRSFDRAPGFTLRMTAELMAALGCTRAMNLDGGSSKRMAVGDRCVDLASTEVVAAGHTSTRRRAVVSAILLSARPGSTH